MFKRAKFFLIIFIVIAVNYLTLDFLLIDVEKTALIIALGVDKTSVGYEVTAQIAVPEATNQSTKSNEAVIYAQGETLYKAISEIGSRTGWYPKLSFCNLIILGESVLSENVMSVLDFFVQSYKVEDSAIVCATDKTAKELLLSISPLDNISGFALSKIFVRDFNGASPILTTSIKEFSKNYFSVSSYGFMPLVKTVKTEDKGDNTSQTATGSEGKGGSGGESKNTPVVYDATTSVMFSGGNLAGYIERDEALFFSLLTKPVTEAFFTIDATNENGETKKALLGIRKSRKNVSIKSENGETVLHCKLKLWLKIIDSDQPETMKEIATLGRIDEKTTRAAENYIKDKLFTLYDKALNLSADIFEVKKRLYRKYGDDYKIHLNNKITPRFEVECVNYI